MKGLVFLLLILLSSSVLINAQNNLLKNSTADSGFEDWKINGYALIERIPDGNSFFVVRNNGAFRQDVELTDRSAGKYILLIGRGSSERVNADGAITGLPYLYGFLMNPITLTGKNINTYLTGQKLRGDVKNINDWVVMYGVFQIPAGTTSARIFLNQAEGRGAPQNGSAARFDDVGLYLFETEKDALDFAKKYE
jgi:hypothetical protein